MTKIKSDCVAYAIVFSLIFTLPLFGCAQNVAVRKPVTVASAQNVTVQKPSVIANSEITKQSIKKESPSVKEETESDSQEEDKNIFSFNSTGSSAKQNPINEEKQEMMEKALDLLEVADKLW
ncbi:MAG TPA: hypothetical protein DDX93_03100, partial [Smithella sp.]|nr:hypothetical protein [Smithella sp.]